MTRGFAAGVSSLLLSADAEEVAPSLSGQGTRRGAPHGDGNRSRADVGAERGVDIVDVGGEDEAFHGTG